MRERVKMNLVKPRLLHRLETFSQTLWLRFQTVGLPSIFLKSEHFVARTRVHKFQIKGKNETFESPHFQFFSRKPSGAGDKRQ